MRGWPRHLIALAGLGVALALVQPACARSDAVAMYGEPALGDDADHFPYANPDAPKGGTIRQVFPGAFDGLNPFIVKGVVADGVRELVYESLMARSQDEPFTLYGLLAGSMDTPPSRDRVTFRLRPEAHFSDGVPVTSDDVIFSFETLRRDGRPNHRAYYKKVIAVERPAPDTVIFIFDPAEQDRELPLLLGLMPILPRHIFAGKAFGNTDAMTPLGSGPYTVAFYEIGRHIVYRRDPDYWGRDLWLNRGRFNADDVRYDYMRDVASAFNALKSGLADIWLERDATQWVSSYDFPALRDGRVVREILPNGRASGMTGFAFNLRRPLFADLRVRQALILLFDADWANRTLFEGVLSPIESHFTNTPLAAKGPATPGELTLLAPYLAHLPAQALTQGWRSPGADGDAALRRRKKDALALFLDAGYMLREGRLVQETTGTPFSFEILVAERADERMALAYGAMLKDVGITVRIQSVDSAQMERRRNTFDFDMTPFRWDGTLSPGNEQLFRWGSAAAGAPGSYNIVGVKNPAIDTVIAALTKATRPDELVDAARALDRMLMANAYVVPLFYHPSDWVAYSARLAHPDRQPLWGFDPVVSPTLWWVRRQAPAQ